MATFDIIIYDIRTNKVTVMEEPTTILNTPIPSLIDQLKKYSISIDGFSIINSEVFIQKYYERLGYSVLRTSYNTPIELPNNVLNNLNNYYIHTNECQVQRTWYHFIRCKGVPDFLVYRENAGEIEELFFVEVKRNLKDVFSISQIIWFSCSNIPVKVAFFAGDL